jgi:hypothetical protein
MKALLLAIALLTNAAAWAQATPEQGIEALDTKAGFRTYKLGTPASQYPNLRARGKAGYVAQGESMSIGDVRLNGLNFSVYKDQLAGVNFSTMGSANVEKLITTLVAEYGPGQAAGYQTQAWKGNVVTMLAVKGGHAPYEFVIVSITSNALMAEETADKAALGKKAAKDL